MSIGKKIHKIFTAALESFSRQGIGVQYILRQEFGWDKVQVIRNGKSLWIYVSGYFTVTLIEKDSIYTFDDRKVKEMKIIFRHH